MSFSHFWRKGRKKFIVILFNIIVLFFALFLFQDFKHGSNYIRQVFDPFQYHEHFSLPHRDVKQYTLPDILVSDISENETLNASLFFSYPNNSRGIVPCNNFESEVRCDELLSAKKSLNLSLFSKKYLFIELPTNEKKAIKSLHFAFVLSIILERRLIVVRSPFKLPKILTRVPRNQKNFSKIKPLKSSSFSHCDLDKILNIKSKSILLKGDWDIIDILLSPTLFNLIPHPFETHGFFLLTRIMNFTKNIYLPPNQLQVGIVIEFSPDEISLLKVINYLSEGYSNCVVHLYSSSHINLQKIIDYYKTNANIKINIIKKLDIESVNVLVQCDKFIGSLGFTTSHILNQIRGRGGIWLDPRNTMITETSSSQSGLLFLMGKTNAFDLMCPGGASAFQHFMLFNAI